MTKLKSCENCIHWEYCDWKQNYYEFGIVCNEYSEKEQNE